MNKKLVLLVIAVVFASLIAQNESAFNDDIRGYFKMAEESVMQSATTNLAARNKKNRESQFRSVGGHETARVNRESVIGLKAAKAFMEDNNLSVTMLSKYRAPEERCPFREVPRCDPNSRYRTIDGTCNNLKFVLFGRSNSPFARLLEPEYDDDFEAPRRKSVTGRQLPNPRLIAANVHFPQIDVPEHEDEGKISSFFTFFNQFLIHDFTLASATSEGYKGDDILECNCLSTNEECLIVKQPFGDLLNTDQECIATPRTAHTFSSFDCTLGRREQLNANTHWLDLNVVYGSTQDFADSLRQFSGGLLRFTQFNKQKEEFLPIFDDMNRFEEGLFIAGDNRVNENVMLQAVHTLFFKEHNRLARELAKLNPHWNDERLYQEARSINIANYLNYIYNENVIIVIGDENYNKFIRPLLEVESIFDYKDVYDPNVSPQILNVFAVAAYRFGHTFVPPSFKSVDLNDKLLSTLTFRDGMKPVFDDHVNDGLRQFVLGSLFFGASVRDEHFISGFFDFLEEEPSLSPFPPADGTFHRLSLPTLNILRGREHGVPAWFKFRQLCDPHFPQNPVWDDVDPSKIRDPSKIIFEQDTFDALRRVYKDVVDIDIFPGGFSEVNQPTTTLGLTFSCIITKQYVKQLVSDRFFFSNGNDERTFGATRFTRPQLAEIRKSSLARLICDIFEPKYVLRNPLLTRRFKLNEQVDCNAIPKQSLEPWKDLNATPYPADRIIKPEYQSREYSNDQYNEYRPAYDEERDSYRGSYRG